MRPSHPPRPALRSAVALAALVASGTLGALCGYDNHVVWLCLNAVTGKEDVNTYDETHVVNGEADPCHCFDPCGPEKTCPSVVDAGPRGPGCDAGP
jgi:hypothetical protein